MAFARMGLKALHHSMLGGAISGCMGGLLGKSTKLRDGGWTRDQIGKLPEGATVGEMINPVDLLLKVSDGPCDEIKAFDGHAPLTFDRDYLTAEDLRAARGEPGKYATCLAEGLMRPFGSFSGRPAYVWGAQVL